MFVTGPTGRRVILDAHPHPKGNLLVERDQTRGGLHARVLVPAEVAKARELGIDLYIDHHVTCPDRRYGRRHRTGSSPTIRRVQ